MGNENQPESNRGSMVSTMRSPANLVLQRVLKSRYRKFKEAILQSNYALTKDCLGLGVDPNVRITMDSYAIHVVCEKCDVPILKLLLTKDLDLEVRNMYGRTALMSACRANCREAVKLLVKAGADPNAKSKNGYTALHLACIYRNVGIIFDLINNGAEINVSNVYQMTPLTIVLIDRPSVPIAKFLLKKGAHLMHNNWFPAFLQSTLYCHTKEQLSMIKLLIRHGIDVHVLHPTEKRNCLHYVSITGYLPLAQYLVSFTSMVDDLFVRDASGRTPMDLTLDHRNYHIFHLFKYVYLKNHLTYDSARRRNADRSAQEIS